jgi:type IV pilus assembly protein PilV
MNRSHARFVRQIRIPLRRARLRRSCGRRLDSGYGMIEVLVSLVVLFLGLLGLIGLQAKAQHAQLESYQRAQALVLLQDMVDRMNTNRKDAHDKKYDQLSVGVGSDGIPSIADCSGKTGWNLDACEWGNLLNGVAEAKDGARIGAMIGAHGCISYGGTELTDSSGAALAGTGVYTITVAWQGMTPTTSPPSTLACGKGTYGSESLRRVASSTLRIGALGAL